MVEDSFLEIRSGFLLCLFTLSTPLSGALVWASVLLPAAPCHTSEKCDLKLD